MSIEIDPIPKRGKNGKIITIKDPCENCDLDRNTCPGCNGEGVHEKETNL